MHLARVLSFKLVYRLSVFLLLFLAVFSLYFSPNQAYEDHCLWLLTEKKRKRKEKLKIITEYHVFRSVILHRYSMAVALRAAYKVKYLVSQQGRNSPTW